MMHIQEFVSLKPYNTFGIEAKARFFCAVESLADLDGALQWAKRQGLAVRVLGGGSNILLSGDVDGLVVLMQNRGIRITEDDGNHATVEVAAGENWHQLVLWSVEHGLGGLENLGLIPGTAGAAPVQNIGAYGVEFAEVCHSVTAVRRDTLERVTFGAADCCFGYRDSLFKHEPNCWVVESIRVSLCRMSPVRTHYGSVGDMLCEMGVDEPDYRDVCEAVCRVRRDKLPDPAELGNAGSFFKNPLVSADKAQELAQRYPGLPTYPQKTGDCKLAAGWLIDKTGWKGKNLGRAGVYPKQALVLVNNGGASGQEILALAESICRDVQEKFGIALEKEPVVFP